MYILRERCPRCWLRRSCGRCALNGCKVDGGIERAQHAARVGRVAAAVRALVNDVKAGRKDGVPHISVGQLYASLVAVVDGDAGVGRRKVLPVVRQRSRVYPHASRLRGRLRERSGKVGG